MTTDETPKDRYGTLIEVGDTVAFFAQTVGHTRAIYVAKIQWMDSYGIWVPKVTERTNSRQKPFSNLDIDSTSFVIIAKADGSEVKWSL